VHDKRVQTVLALRNEFANHTHDDYLKLMNDWDSAPEADTVSKAVETEHKEIQKKFFLKQVNRERLRSVVDFFDTLSACVEQGSCDRNTAVYLFGSAANQVFNISAFHVEDTRTDENPDFGRGLENIYRLEPENFLLSYL
jgi:hypothetical protein